MSFLKIATGLAFGIAGAVFSITALRRHRRIQRAWERCRGTRAESPEQARALARRADEATAKGDGAPTVAYERCALEGQARTIAYTN